MAAPSTFYERRTEMAKHEVVASSAKVRTPDACFIPVLPSTEKVSTALVAATVKSQAFDTVVISAGGMRIELTGAYADRIVWQSLGGRGVLIAGLCRAYVCRDLVHMGALDQQCAREHI